MAGKDAFHKLIRGALGPGLSFVCLMTVVAYTVLVDAESPEAVIKYVGCAGQPF